MNCCGKHKRLLTETTKPTNGEQKAPKELSFSDYAILPNDQCVFCAEKHLSDAWDLVREAGYIFPNRQKIIGALGSASSHLFVEHRELSRQIRDARHLVQFRREEEIDWLPLVSKMDALANAEATKSKEVKI